MEYPKLTPVVADGSTEPRYVGSRFSDHITPKDFGAKGDGTTDDTSAFASLETAVTGRMIDLCGCKYKVQSEPRKNIYYNGFFVVNNSEIIIENSKVFVRNNITNGHTALNPSIISFNNIPDTYDINKATDVFICGADSCKYCIDNNESLPDVVAIGGGTLQTGKPGQHTIAIGNFALHNLDRGEGSGANTSDRNIAIGSLALVGLKTGRENVAIGRDAGQDIKDGYDNTIVGYAAVGGWSHIRLNDTIYPDVPSSIYNNVVVGAWSGGRLNGGSCNTVVVGAHCLSNCPADSNSCYIGYGVCSYNGKDNSLNNKTTINDEKNGTYHCVGNNITITISSHNAVANQYIVVKFTSGALSESVLNEQQIIKVSSIIDENNFIATTDYNIPDSTGNCTVYTYEQSTDAGGSYWNVVIGSIAGSYHRTIHEDVVIGRGAALGDESDATSQTAQAVCIGVDAGNKCKSLWNSVLIGYRVEKEVEFITREVAIGFQAGTQDTEAQDNVLIGNYAGNVLKTRSGASGLQFRQNVAIGSTAMKNMVNGDSDVNANLTNSICIGYNSRVSGSNQCQLGNSSVTTYVFGSVQNRSDARDKADVRDTTLGLSFLLALRPVDFKWDYRDDYIDTIEREIEVVNEDGFASIEVIHGVARHKKDGSRKRNRYHHGLVAQEVKAVLDDMGVDFGGYQDHKINGGNDVLTLGYEEFIAPIIKSIQQINERLVALEGE